MASTYIIVSKDKLLLNLLNSTATLNQPSTVVIHGRAEFLPRDATNKAAPAPWL